MKKIYSVFALALCVMCSDVSFAQETKTKTKIKTTGEKKPMMEMPDSAAMMKAWENYMTPGAYHQMFAKSDGTWNEEVTMWMDPAAPPMKSTATAVNKMIMGGRYQQSTHTGDFNGMPFEGLSIVGFDNAKKVFVSSWIDNMGTGIMNMEGKWDEKSKAVIFKGKSVDPMTGRDLMVREIFKIVDDNTQVLEMFDNRMGKENKIMEIRFTRK
jgi:hypothetical protein